MPTESLTLDTGVERELPAGARGPEARAVASSLGRQVEAALPRLEPKFREAVVLRDLEELSYREIAEVLEVPIGTVRSRIARGRDQLRRVLQTLGEQSTS